MADDPLFGFKPVQQSAPADDPLMGFKPAQPGFTDYLLQHLAGGSANPNAPGKPLGQTAFWNKPADVSWGDYAQAHLQPLEDMGRSAANTFGFGDSLLASQKAVYNDLIGNAQNPNTVANVVRQQITGQSDANDYLTNLAAEKAKTAAAEARMPVQNRLAANVIGSGPLGEVAASVRAAPYVSKLPGWLASRVAGATVGAGSTAAGEVARNESLSPRDIGVGTVFGGVFGAPSGGTKLPVSPSAKSYFDEATREYKPLTNILYDATKEVHPQIDITDAKNAKLDWSGYKWDDAPKTQAEVKTLLDKPQLSANDIQQAQRALGKVQGNPNASDNDQIYAKYFKDRLQHVLENGMPQTGVPQNLPPGVTPSNYAAYVKSKGDFFTGQGNDMQRADVWHGVGATTAGTDIGTQAGSFSADQAKRAAQGQSDVWAPPGSPYFNATEALAKTTGKPTAMDWGTKHFVLGPLATIGLGEAANAATGGEGTGHQPWYTRLGGEIAAGLLYAGGKAGYSRYTAAANVAKQQAAEAAVRQTIASRTPQNPLGTYTQPGAPPSPQWLDGIRRLIYGQSAAGKLPGQ